MSRDSSGAPGLSTAKTTADVRRSIGLGSGAFVLIALLLPPLGGLWSDLSPGMLAAFLIHAAFAAMAHEVIVGLAAMHAGWFPPSWSR
jgi:hypothetical protein